MLKRCARCKTEKPLDQFWRRASAKDGLYAWRNEGGC